MQVTIAPNLGNPLEQQGSAWHNPSTRQTIGLSPEVVQSIKRILEMDLSAQADNGQAVLDQILGLELVDRGFLIPTQGTDPDEHMRRTNPTELVNSLFYLPTSYYDMLPANCDAAVVGIPTDIAGGRPGSRFGPERIRDASRNLGFRSSSPDEIVSLTGRHGIFTGRKVFDCGDIITEHASATEIRRSVVQVAAELANKTLPIFLGGDHSMTLSVVDGLVAAHGETFEICQFDHHLDIQFSRYGEGSLPKVTGVPSHGDFVSHLKTRYPAIKVTHIGVSEYQSFKGVSSGQAVKYLDSLGAQISDVALAQDEKNALKQMPVGKKIYCTIDVDVFARHLIPETGYPADIGITLSTFFNVFQNILENNQVIGLDLMEFGMVYQLQDRESASFCAKLLLAILRMVTARRTDG